MQIKRPPLVESFDLPTREDILEAKWIKLIFTENGQGGERMWVRITDKSDINEWVGVLDNEPFLLTSIALDDEVRFHPLDSIDAMP